MYTFDIPARIQFSVEAHSADDAANYFHDAIRRAEEYGKIEITVDSYSPAMEVAQ